MAPPHQHVVVDAGRSPLSYAAEMLGMAAGVGIVCWFVVTKVWVYVLQPLWGKYERKVASPPPPANPVDVPPPVPNPDEHDDEIVEDADSASDEVPVAPVVTVVPAATAEIRKTAPQLIILVAAIVIFFLFAWSPSQSYNSTAVRFVRNVPYVFELFEYAGGEVVDIPIPDCAFYTQAEWLQATVLEPVVEAAHGYAEPAVRKAREEQRQYILKTRRKAQTRCVLRPENVHPLTTLATGDYAALVDSAPFWLLPRDPLLTNSTDFRVRHVLFDRRKQRYYRVAMVRDGMLRPTVVSEAALLTTAEEYWTTFKTKLRFGEKVTPNICASHLGIINSGLVLHLSADNEWQLFLNTKVVRDVEGMEVGGSRMHFPEHLFKFPAVVDARFNVSVVAHAESSYVSFTSVAALLKTKSGLERLHQVEPRWFAAEGEEVDDEEDLSRLVAISVEQIDPFPQGSLLGSTDNACVHHCLALDFVSVKVLDGERRRPELASV